MALSANPWYAAETTPAPARRAVWLLCLGAGLALGTIIGAVPLAVAAVVMAGALGAILAIGFPHAGGCLFVCALVAVADADAGYGQHVWPIRDVEKIRGLPSALWSFFLVLFGGAMFRLYFVQRGSSRVPLFYFAIYAGILLFAAAVGLRNGWPMAGMHAESFRLLYPVMFFYLAIHLFDSRERIRRALWILFGVAAITAAVLSCYYLAGRGVLFELEGGTKTSRIVTDDSAVLMTFTAMLLLALGQVMSGRAGRALTLLLAAGCTPLVVALLFSFRRAEWMGVAGGVLVLLLAGSRAERVRLLRFLAPVVPVLLLVFGAFAWRGESMHLGGHLTRRFETLLDGRHSSNRYHMFESLQTLKDLERRPFTGLGLASSHSPLPQFPDSGVPRNVVHNTWIFVWMKLGLPGLLALVWVSVLYLRRIAGGLRGPSSAAGRPLLLALAALMPIWFMQSVSGPMPWYPRMTMQVALYAAMALNLVYLDRVAAGARSSPRREEAG